jgi:hypothetical protein
LNYGEILYTLFRIKKRVVEMGNACVPKANFEQVQEAIRQKAVLISVLGEKEQGVLLSGTQPLDLEVAAVQAAISSGATIFVYGTNDHDPRAAAKCEQLEKLGAKPRLYVGGLFEWLLLQDIYGAENFPTTAKTNQLLDYRPK